MWLIYPGNLENLEAFRLKGILSFWFERCPSIRTWTNVQNRERTSSWRPHRRGLHSTIPLLAWFTLRLRIRTFTPRLMWIFYSKMRCWIEPCPWRCQLLIRLAATQSLFITFHHSIGKNIVKNNNKIGDINTMPWRDAACIWCWRLKPEWRCFYGHLVPFNSLSLVLPMVEAQ